MLIKKSKVLLASKYDISQKILKELANFESRHILFAIIKHPKSILDIAQEQKIPLSSVYKKIQKLKVCALVSEQKEFLDNRHIATYYQSLIKEVEISISKFEPTISFNKNKLIKK